VAEYGYCAPRHASLGTYATTGHFAVFLELAKLPAVSAHLGIPAAVGRGCSGGGGGSSGGGGSGGGVGGGGSGAPGPLSAPAARPPLGAMDAEERDRGESEDGDTDICI